MTINHYREIRHFHLFCGLALHNSHVPGTIASSKDSLKFLARTFFLILWNFTTIGLVLLFLQRNVEHIFKACK